MEAGFMKKVLRKWKLDWWKEYCWNGSWIDERILY